MDIRIRPAAPADAEAAGRIIHEAFTGIAEHHRFPSDFPTPDDGIRLATWFIDHPSIYGVVAEVASRIVGSNFLDERDHIRGLGPITIARAHQQQDVGRRLMEAVLERGRGAPGIRLLQDSFNTLSISLYAKLGFDVIEPIVLMTGAHS